MNNQAEITLRRTQNNSSRVCQPDPKAVNAEVRTKIPPTSSATPVRHTRSVMASVKDASSGKEMFAVTSSTDEANEEYLNVKETSKFLGNISVSTLYSRLDPSSPAYDERMPKQYKFGPRLVRWKKSELVAYRRQLIERSNN